jgi:hypothetical protein
MEQDGAENSTDILCECCGEAAKRYEKSFPICNNPVCFQLRIEYIGKMINDMNNKLIGDIENA